MTDVVIGVIGGSGGAGSSYFAAVLAALCLPSVLLDVDPVGGGVDVLLGIESVPGARWSGLRLDGGRLDPALLADGLPTWRDVAVLAVDREPPSPGSALEVVEAAAQLGTVVLDLPRSPSLLRDCLLRRCGLCVVVVVAEVRGLAAARAVLQTVVKLPVVVPVGVVIRRGTSISIGDAAELLDVPVLGVLPRIGRVSPRTNRLPRAAARVACGVLDAIDGAGSGMSTSNQVSASRGCGVRI